MVHKVSTTYQCDLKVVYQNNYRSPREQTFLITFKNYSLTTYLFRSSLNNFKYTAFVSALRKIYTIYSKHSKASIYDHSESFYGLHSARVMAPFVCRSRRFRSWHVCYCRTKGICAPAEANLQRAREKERLS